MNEQIEASGDLASTFGALDTTSEIIYNTVADTTSGKSEQEDTNMKKNIGSQLALYPAPVTVIGVMNGDKPTWTLVAHVGIIGHGRILVSLAASHFINGIIKENKILSINIVDEGILPQAPLVMECTGESI